jgi:hypothetical protein
VRLSIDTRGYSAKPHFPASDTAQTTPASSPGGRSTTGFAATGLPGILAIAREAKTKDTRVLVAVVHERRLPLVDGGNNGGYITIYCGAEVASAEATISGFAGVCTAVRSDELGLCTAVLEAGSDESYPCGSRRAGGIFHVSYHDVKRLGPDELLAAINRKTSGGKIGNCRR